MRVDKNVNVLFLLQLAQPIRFLLAYLNVDYEHRVFEYGSGPDEADIYGNFRNVQNTFGLEFPEVRIIYNIQPYLLNSENQLNY